MSKFGAFQFLVQAAQRASQQAYCPYSGFPVGAAVMAEGGEVFTACNVENASYGLSMCAQRNAIFQMAASGERKIEAVAIFTPTPQPSAPCGACRQVIHEFGPQAAILCGCDSDERLETTLERLLPQAFGPRNL